MKAVLRSIGIAFLLSGIAMGCNQEEEKAQKEAAEKAEKAKVEAEQAAVAKKAADEAAAKAAKERADARQVLQKDFDGVDRKLASLKERAAKAKGAAKKNAEAAVGEVDKRRETVQADLKKLESETGNSWDGAKTAAETDLASLKKSLDVYETAVMGK
jgi:hypothetical protein